MSRFAVRPWRDSLDDELDTEDAYTRGYPKDIYYCDACGDYSVLLHKVDGTPGRYFCPRCAVKGESGR